jgi:putative membrane protein
LERNLRRAYSRIVVSAILPGLADVDFDHMGDGWGVLMVIGMIAFWIAAVVLVVWLVRGGAGHAGAGSNEPTALEILDRRFAEGSISADEYRERRDTLREGSS